MGFSDWLMALVALIASLFYGCNALKIFDMPSEERSGAWRLHQFWLHFLGSAVGWIAFWFLVPHVKDCLMRPCAPVFTSSDVVLFFLAFVGVTGHLPLAVVGVLFTVTNLLDRIVRHSK
jgi:hypothetical protein